jgi:hypothetical protein
VEIDRFTPAEAVGDHYVVLAELMAHKRIAIAVEAFSRLGLPLVVVGDGPEGRRLRRLAGPNVRFTGRITDEEVARVLEGARALVVTATEEFGIAAVEALAAGRPVIALDEGGVRESVEPGVTGAFYERNDPRRWPRRCSPSTPRRSIRRSAAPPPSGSACRASRTGWRRSSPRPTSDERPPRPGERSRLQAGLLHGARRRVVR